MVTMTTTAATVVVALILLILIAVPLVVIALALVTTARHELRKRRRRPMRRRSDNGDGDGDRKVGEPGTDDDDDDDDENDNDDHFRDWSEYGTALYSGRVTHTRYRPVVHAFSYPIFFACVDLDEVESIFGRQGRRLKEEEEEEDDDDRGRGAGSVTGNGRRDASKGKRRRRSTGALWPLSLLMRFRHSDHLKNGEGIAKCEATKGGIEKGKEKEGDASSATKENNKSRNDIKSRVMRLVMERTGGACQPDPDQRVLLLTHLSYFGYCFNPVSFYYVLKEKNGKGMGRKDGLEKKEKETIERVVDTNGGGGGGNGNDGSGGDTDNDVFHDLSLPEYTVDAIVAEVSNTPWNEMRCYVLHPNSVDVTSVKPGRSKRYDDRDDDRDRLGTNGLAAPATKSDDGSERRRGGTGDDEKKDQDDDDETVLCWASTNYVFPKTFHVSPFMSMDHTYDWTFWNPRRDRIVASTSMLQGGRIPYFNAHLDICRREPFHPLDLCWQLLRLPAYCAVVQLWIHVEAFRIFWKGVAFVPHPEGTETHASVAIGWIMAPFFAVKEWYVGGRSGGRETRRRMEEEKFGPLSDTNGLSERKKCL